MSLMMRLGSSLKFAGRLIRSNAQCARHVAFSQRYAAPVWCRGVASAGSSSTTFLPKDAVQDRVLEVIRNFPKIDPAKVNASVHFQNDLAIDSLDQVELVMAFEDEFNIEITDEDAEKINTADDAIRYIAAHPMAK